MKIRKTMILGIFLLIMTGMGGIGVSSGYSTTIMPTLDQSTSIIWEVLQTPTAPVQSYWTGGGYWITQSHANMTFAVESVDDDVTGRLTLGNMTVLTNDTMISRDLALGVWGVVEFSPGLFIETNSTAITKLIITAYEAAERVKWNYLNGTMHAHYDTYTINDVEYNCIFFEYQQDPTSFGTPQHTQLIYSLSTGILLYANTSYYFGEPYQPYHFEIKFLAIEHHGTMPNPMILYAVVSSGILVIGVVLILSRRRH